MKYKLIRALALLALILAFTACAHADMPINPYFVEAQLTDPLPLSARKTAKGAKGLDLAAITISLTRNNTSDAFGKDTTWTATVKSDGTDVTDSFIFRYYMVNLINPDAENPLATSNMNVNSYRSWSASRQYTYRFVVPDIYVLRVEVKYTGDVNADAFAASLTETELKQQVSDKAWNVKIPATFTEDSSRPTVATKVADIAGQCNAACRTDYEKALWLHDWLNQNACYDDSLTYYSADGVLFRGTGVCDSYSKAYEMLLNAVGIENVRTVGGNHAWNQLLLEGLWCQVDTTWDDTGDTGIPEGHAFFCLTDALMDATGHTWDPNNYPQCGPCTSLANQYFIRNGWVSSWRDILLDNLLSRLEAGNNSGSLSFLTSYPDENGGLVNRYVGYALLVDAMSASDHIATRCESNLCLVGYSIAQESLKQLPRLSWQVTRLSTLVLPSALTGLDAHAFSGTACEAVLLPEGLQSIGSNAFADCDALRLVVFRDTVSSIDAHAFDGADNVILCGEAAREYAQSHGLSWIPWQ